eukprot:gene19009-22625_t
MARALTVSPVQLRDKTDKPGIGLGQTGTWPVEDEPLALTLRVKPVRVATKPPC